MAQDTLAATLEREHHEIDAGIEAFTAGRASGAGDTAALIAATAALRRHIYLEEQFLFPPLRAAGMLAPVLVMLREHGELWSILDRLDRDPAPEDAAFLALCDDLTARLQAHNAKEEPIIYPRADAVLSEAAASELRAFLESGRMPDGWSCAQAPA